MSKHLFKFSIDRGGTFTDIFCEFHDISDPSTIYYDSYKLLSIDPLNYPDASLEGIRRLLEKHTHLKFPISHPIDTSFIKSIRIGTTVATNALLERKGEPMALLITKGFKDLIHIGNQARPDIFDLEIKSAEKIYEKVIEIDERVILQKSLNGNYSVEYEENQNLQEGISGDKIIILQKPDYVKIKQDLQDLYNSGIKSIAVVLMHSFIFADHEKHIGKIAFEIGFEQVSLSSVLFPRIKIVNRGQTACIDAYLNPAISRYLIEFTKGFDDNLIKNVNLFFMQSDGGLSNIHTFSGVRAILSGPSGGVVGYGLTTYFSKRNQEKLKMPILGFDMGGTSTDVSKFSGKFEHIFETKISGVNLTIPQLDIHTVAAGGGSRLYFENRLFKVGPDSSGAHPGPVCYRKNGFLSITDANLILGRVLPKYFPHIFGKNQNLPLDYDGTKFAFEEITKIINEFENIEFKKKKTIFEVAYGFIKVANEIMCRAIKAITQARGIDPQHFILSVFGGAGGQHACSMARTLRIRHIFIHKLCGILSAYGIHLANVTKDSERPWSQEYSKDAIDSSEIIIKELKEENNVYLILQGFEKHNIEHEIYLNLKYEGSDNTIMISKPKDNDYAKVFEEKHRIEFGFTLVNRKMFIENIRVRSNGINKKDLNVNYISIDKLNQNSSQLEFLKEIKPIDYHLVYFENLNTGELEAIKTPLYNLSMLPAQTKLDGPCVILNNNSTIIIEPGCLFEKDEEENIWIDVQNANNPNINEVPIVADPIQLTLFANRFMSTAEQMGHILQRTAVSTNIKERLDFSCAIFGPEGNLISNAPHLPVHLGSMQEAVRFQINYLGQSWKQGEVILANHPQAGGTHLPDMTIISPVYQNEKPVFYVASRGHHADIGGKTAGSMPSFSRYLYEEGVAIMSFKIVKNGVFQEEEIINLMENKSEINKEAS